MKTYLINSDLSKLSTQLQNYQVDFALYRDKNNPNYVEIAQEFIDICKRSPKLSSFLHQDYILAKKLGASGVHLTSLQFDKIPDAKALGLEVIISTHTFEEIEKAQALGADYVTYSPIFHSPNKGEPKGIADLKDVVEKSSMKIFALGGIVSQDQIDAVAQTGAYGFASIRYFEDLR